MFHTLNRHKLERHIQKYTYKNVKPLKILRNTFTIHSYPVRVGSFSFSLSRAQTHSIFTAVRFLTNACIVAIVDHHRVGQDAGSVVSFRPLDFCASRSLTNAAWDWWTRATIVFTLSRTYARGEETNEIGASG